MSFSFLFIEQDCLNCGYWTHTFRWYCSPRHEPMLLINDISTRHSKSSLFSRCVGLDQIGQQSRIWEHSQCKTTTARPFCVNFYQFLFDVVPTHQAIAGGKKPDARIRLGHFVLKCAKEFGAKGICNHTKSPRRYSGSHENVQDCPFTVRLTVMRQASTPRRFSYTDFEKYFRKAGAPEGNLLSKVDWYTCMSHHKTAAGYDLMLNTQKMIVLHQGPIN